MLIFGDPVQALLPGPIHLLVILAVSAWLVARGISRYRKHLLWLLGFGFAWTWIFSTAMPASLMLRQIEGPVQPDAALLVGAADENRCRVYLVVGAGEPGSPTESNTGDPVTVMPAQLTSAGMNRLLAAIHAWRRHGGHIVLAGGLGTHPNPSKNSVSAVMYQQAHELGVPLDVMTPVGHQSTNTAGDLAAAIAWLNGADGQRTIKLTRAGCHINVVTSAVHMPRTLATARKLSGGTTTFRPPPTDYLQLRNPSWRAWFPSHHGPTLWEPLLHETIGTLYYWWRGRL